VKLEEGIAILFAAAVVVLALICCCGGVWMIQR
jgi:hypothetical protein